MEIIQDEWYVYARDINYVSTYLSARKQLSEPGNSQLAVAAPKLICSKLLAMHHNIIGESKRSSKHLKTKKVNELTRDLLRIDDLELAKF
ncbi:18223_t:CDS:2, partial [Cetraspora pellucida]